MKASSIRFIVVLAAVCIAGITIIQFYWVRRAFNLKEQEFDRNVNTALLNVAYQVFDINGTPSPANNPVKQLSTNYYVVMVNGEIDAHMLEFLLVTEFEKRNIRANFEYGIYDCTNDKIVYGNYITLEDSKSYTTSRELPKWTSQGYYFGVQFPYREANILNQMGIWSFSTIVLLIVIIFFVYTLFVIFKQKRLSEVQKDFINNITHEFKTPISTIALSTEVIKDPQTTRERILSYATIVEKENNRMKQQVERVLQLASIDRGAMSLKHEPVDIHSAIHEAIDRTNPALVQKKGVINVRLSAKEHTCHADKLHITNSVFNLLDNAIQYCLKSPDILVSTDNLNGVIVVVVRDNGIGISPDDQRHVFQKFFRVSTGNVYNTKGFGLGLNYVRSVVVAHRGRITLHSEPDKGSSFSVFLPLIARENGLRY